MTSNESKSKCMYTTQSTGVCIHKNYNHINIETYTWSEVLIILKD